MGENKQSTISDQLRIPDSFQVLTYRCQHDFVLFYSVLTKDHGGEVSILSSAQIAPKQFFRHQLFC